MKLIQPLVFLFIGWLTTGAQAPGPDIIETSKGAIKIQPISHGSLVLEYGEEVIYFDPTGGLGAYQGIADPTIIAITDIHGDHLDIKTLEAINSSNADILVPQAVADLLPEPFKDRIRILANGENTEIRSIPFTAVPMYNLPEEPDSRHTKGRGNGYLLDLGGKRFYISGDTEDIAEMRALENIDVAFICMNQPYTMSIHQAANAVLDFKPQIVYPFHYRGKEGLSDIKAFKLMVISQNGDIEVRLRDWYPLY